MAAIAQLGERQTEDLKVPGSIPGRGSSFSLHVSIINSMYIVHSVATTSYDKNIVIVKSLKSKHDHDGIRTHNLPIRSRTPYPLGHAAIPIITRIDSYD